MNAFPVLFYWDKYVEEEGVGGGSGKQEIGNHLCKEKSVMNSFSLWPLSL